MVEWNRRERQKQNLPTYFVSISHALLLFDHAVDICAIQHNVLNRLSKMVPRVFYLLTVLTSSQQISIQPPHVSRAFVFVADQGR